MTDFQVQRMANTKSTACIRSIDETLAECTQGNPCSAPKSTSEETSFSSCFHSSPRHSSSEGPLTSSSCHEGPSTPGKSVFKRKGRSFVGRVPNVVAKGPEFPGAQTHSDSQEGSGSHFPDPKVVPTKEDEPQEPIPPACQVHLCNLRGKCHCE